CEEAGLLAVDGDEIWLGKNLEQILGLKRFDDGAEIDIWAEEKKIENIADGLCAGVGRRSAIKRSRLRGLKIYRTEATELSGADSTDGVARAVGEEVHTELCDRAAIYFGEFHLQQDFLGSDRAEGEHINDFRRVGTGEFSCAFGDVFGGNVA